jgi:ketosteroid isomerase-like protein
MNLSMQAILAIAAAISGASASEPVSPPADLALAVKAYDAAQVGGDRAALESLLDDRYLLVNSRGKHESKSELIADYTAPGFRLEPFIVEEPVEIVWSDGAVMGGVATLRGTDDGRPYEVRLRFTDVWAKRSGRWKVLYTQASRELNVPLRNAPMQASKHDSAADSAEVAALDLAFQSAVKRNDAPAIEKILHPNFWLVLGNGTVVTRQELIDEARSGAVNYELQDEDPGTQTVRVWNDTAVVTARLRIKGVRKGAPFNRTLWFSDTYVRTPAGWRYAFAQASLPLPD